MDRRKITERKNWCSSLIGSTRRLWWLRVSHAVWLEPACQLLHLLGPFRVQGEAHKKLGAEILHKSRNYPRFDLRQLPPVLFPSFAPCFTHSFLQSIIRLFKYVLFPFPFFFSNFYASFSIFLHLQIAIFCFLHPLPMLSLYPPQTPPQKKKQNRCFREYKDFDLL